MKKLMFLALILVAPMLSSQALIRYMRGKTQYISSPGKYFVKHKGLISVATIGTLVFIDRNNRQGVFPPGKHSRSNFLMIDQNPRYVVFGYRPRQYFNRLFIPVGWEAEVEHKVLSAGYREVYTNRVIFSQIKTVVLYECGLDDYRFPGKTFRLLPGIHGNETFPPNLASFVYVPKGESIVLYAGCRRKYLKSGSYNLREFNMNDRVNKVQIRNAR